MDDLNARYKLWDEAPKCCKTCKLLDLDKLDDERVLVSCSRDIRLPVIKGTCTERVNGCTGKGEMG